MSRLNKVKQIYEGQFCRFMCLCGLSSCCFKDVFYLSKIEHYDGFDKDTLRIEIITCDDMTRIIVWTSDFDTIKEKLTKVS